MQRGLYPLAKLRGRTIIGPLGRVIVRPRMACVHYFLGLVNSLTILNFTQGF